MVAEVVTVAARPDLIPEVARWLWDEFWRKDLHPLEDAVAELTAATATVGPPQCFVLLLDGTPAGTASLVAHDLEERPDLTPWLASVLVLPEARGQGLVRQLIAAVEREARAAGYRTLWLFTLHAERIYARSGWIRTETVQHRGREVVVMRRDLAP